MDANLDKIATELYGKIESRFSPIEIGDEHAEPLSKEEDIPKARFFEFKFFHQGEDIASITISLSQSKGVVMQISMTSEAEGINHPRLDKFIRACRIFAKKRLLNFDAFITGKSELDKRDYHFQSSRKEEPQMEPVMESKLYGSTKISYQDLGEAQLIIKHTQPVNTELAAGRTMHIENIYIENAQGERFRYPAKHLNGARALAEHIKAGGTPYDSIGQHICGLSEELASLRKFKNYVGRQEQLSEAMGDITSKVMERIESIKKEVSNLQRPSYYAEFAEAFEAREEQMIPEEIMNDWVDRLTIRTFNEELKSVFPYIYKLVDESELPVVELGVDDILGEESEDYSYDESFDSSALPEELELEAFMNDIVEDGNEFGDGIFDANPDTRKRAVDELNDIFKSEVKGGLNVITTLQDLIPSTPDYPNFLDQFKDSDPELDARESIRLELTKLAKENTDDADLARTLQQIDFSGEGGSSETPAEPVPPAEPSAAPAPAEPAAAPATPEQPAPVAESEDPPFDGPYKKAKGDVTDKSGAKHGAHSQAKHLAHRGILKAIQKAKDAGASLDTRFNVNGKEMTLHDAIEECGMTPMECGFDTAGAGDLDAMKKFMSGFFNREERNFTIGGERLKIKLEKEFPDANPAELETMFKFIDKIDPPSDVRQQHDILRLAGVKHDHAVDEESSDFDYRNEMDKASDDYTYDTDKKSGHGTAYDDEGNMMPGWSTDENGDPVWVGGDFVEPATKSSAEASRKAAKPAPAATNAGKEKQMSMLKQMMKNAGIQMPRLPGFDGDEGDEIDIDNMGPQIQNHVGKMMKGIQSKIPAGNMTSTSTSSGSIDGKPASFDDAMSKFKGMNMPGLDMPSPSNDGGMDFKPAGQSRLLQVDNPEYVARRAAALKKPGAVVGHSTVSEELSQMLKIAGVKK